MYLTDAVATVPAGPPRSATLPRPAPSAPKRPSHFFAFRPALGAISEMAELRDHRGFTGSPVRDEHLHVTLFWLGYDHPGTPALIGRAREVAASIAAPPLRIVFDKLVAAEGNLLLLPAEPLHHLRAFQQRLATALAVAGVRADPDWRFHPHATLRRGPPGGVAGAILPIAWTAAELVLIRSIPDPFRHETVGVRPLRERLANAPSPASRTPPAAG